MVAIVQSHALQAKSLMPSSCPKTNAAQESIKVQGRQYARLRDEGDDINVLRRILENIIADSER